MISMSTQRTRGCENNCVQPVFIVGAPRCGKKMMSEILARHPEVSSFPHEMTFLWRYGHAGYAYDSLRPEQLNERIAGYIRGVFDHRAQRSGVSTIVDRTDHNVVRLEYVRAVFPECRIVHVVRDARASVASAMKRRQGNPELGYYFSKAMTVPAVDFCRHCSRYAWDVFQANLGKDRYRKVWGIRTPGTAAFDSNPSLSAKCAAQWRECVRSGIDSRASFDDSNYMLIRYEDAVRQPLETAKDLFRFVGLSGSSAIDDWLHNNVRTSSLEQWRTNLTSSQEREVIEICNAGMSSLGYCA